MNEGQVKLRIFIMQLVDWLVFLAILAVGYYLIRYSDNYEMAALIVLSGLLVVSKLGNYTRQKIARLHVDMDIERKRKSRLRPKT